MNGDLSTAILREIRDEIRQTNTKLDQTNAKLDQANARLDQTNAKLDDSTTRTEGGFDTLSRRLVESEMRTVTALVELAGSVREVTDLLRSQHDLRPRVEKCEAEIGALKKKVEQRKA